ncbi:MAG: hypothetical protein Ct9H300mP30_2430 [Methanobacteriota archaeon]|nr:MAG: hypothetical protein Ct9H300mP30_2430 [Euryarchaeota archaeon]
METEYERRRAFLEERLKLEAFQDVERMQRRVEMDLREAMESGVHRKVEAHRLDQEMQRRERLSDSRREREAELEKQLKDERASLEKEMKADVDVRIKELEEESERSALAELDRRFRAERETMEVALALRRQEMALEQEVEMEQRVAEFAKKREAEMMAKLEEQFAKRGDLSKKEVKEILKSLEAVLKSKWEAALLDAKQSALERVGED